MVVKKMASNHEKTLYKDYEKVCNKLDAVLVELSTIKKNIKKN